MLKNLQNNPSVTFGASSLYTREPFLFLHFFMFGQSNGFVVL